MKKTIRVLIFLASCLSLSYASDKISFKELTQLASQDLGKNIYLDKDLPKYSVDFNLVDYQKKGEIYEFYKIVLFEHDLQLQFNNRGNFYFIKNKEIKEEIKDLPRLPLPAISDRLHYYTYKIRNTTNEDVVNALAIFPNVKFKHLKQSDTIAYSATRSDHVQVMKILRRSDNKVSNKTIRLTMFSVNRKNLLEFGSQISEFSFKYNSAVGGILDSLSKGSTSSYNLSTSANIAFTLSALQSNNAINILQKPTILLTNGIESSVKSVVNVPYLQTTSTVDSTTNSVIEQYEYKDIGLQINIKPKIKDNWAYLELDLISDELISLDDNKPITQKVSYKNTVTVFAGRPVLLNGY